MIIALGVPAVILALFVGHVAYTLITSKDKGYPFACKMDWHKAPKEQGFDGCSKNGKCPKCGEKVLLDSQGNWFGIGREI